MASNGNGLKNTDKNYSFKRGAIPILISAPHAVNCYRESQIRGGDYLTGPLAMYLANLCDCSYFIRTYNDNDDPNYPLGITLPVLENEYLRALTKLITAPDFFLVIDLHGFKYRKKAACSIWTDDNNPCDPVITSIFFKNFKLQNFSYDQGSEYLGGQVTRQSALITQAFQLEIKRSIRSLKLENLHLLKQFILAMQQSISETYEYSRRLEKIRS